MRLFKKKSKHESRVRAKTSTPHPTTFSYYARSASFSKNDKFDRKQSTNLENKSQNKRFKLIYLPSYIAIFAILIALGFSLLLESKPRITIINAPGTVQRNSDTYNEAISLIWKKSFFNLNKLTISTSKIQQEIENAFPELTDAQIELPLLGRRASVVLTPTNPALQMVSINGLFYVDVNGKVLAKTSDLQKNDLENLPFLRDESGIVAEPGKNIFSRSDTEFLTNIFNQLQSENIQVELISLPTGSAEQVNIKIVGVPYYVKFALDNDPRLAVGTYVAVKTKLESEGITPTEYIDARVAEKVFYK